MLSPVHLHTLIAVVRTGSFADAARRLGYTSSAVSQQIAALERSIKVPLFERDARSIRATAAAEILALRAQQALAGLEALRSEIDEIAAGNLGRIRLGSFPTASHAIVPLALAAFRKEYPAVDIQLDEGEPDELIGLIEDGLLNLTLVYQYDLVPRRWPSKLVRSPLLEESLVLLLPAEHRLAGSTEVELSELRDESWVATRESTAGATCLRRMCANSGFEPAVNFRSNDYGVIHAFVGSGLGVAVVPTLSRLPHDGVVGVELTGVDVRRRVTALHRVGDSNPTITTMLRALRSAAALIADTSDLIQARPIAQ